MNVFIIKDDLIASITRVSFCALLENWPNLACFKKSKKIENHCQILFFWRYTLLAKSKLLICLSLKFWNKLTKVKIHKSVYPISLILFLIKLFNYPKMFFFVDIHFNSENNCTIALIRQCFSNFVLTMNKMCHFKCHENVLWLCPNFPRFVITVAMEKTKTQNENIHMWSCKN